MTINPLSTVNQTWFSAITNKVTGTSNTSATTANTSDSSQVSPFAQLMSTLQQLQQSNPDQFKKVTATLASDLQQAASNAQNNSNTGEATVLNQLASVFNQASQTGQLPSFTQNGPQSTGASGHHHHHHHGGGQALGQDLNSISQNILSSLDPSTTSISTESNTQPQS